MPQDFVLALRNLRYSRPEDVISQLQGVFSSIASMSFTDAMVAYQTINTFAASTEFSKDMAVQGLLDALEVRMQTAGGIEAFFRISEITRTRCKPPRKSPLEW